MTSNLYCFFQVNHCFIIFLLFSEFRTLFKSIKNNTKNAFYLPCNFRSLRISHAKFSAPEVSLDIHAQKLESIALEHLTLEGDFSVLLQTQDTHHLSNLFLKYCNIENLGEINLSTRYVSPYSYTLLTETVISDLENDESMETQIPKYRHNDIF